MSMPVSDPHGSDHCRRPTAIEALWVHMHIAPVDTFDAEWRGM